MPPAVTGAGELDVVNDDQSSPGRSFVSLLESLEISEKAAFNASSSGSNSSALAFIAEIVSLAAISS